MKPIEVPQYVADDFYKPLTHPSRAAGSVDQSLKRVYKLIAHSLKDLKDAQWEVNTDLYRSSYRVEPYGFERVADRFYIYAEEKGKRSAIAIFLDDHMAAKYFVWLVSGGTKSIDWSLFLDMES